MSSSSGQTAAHPAAGSLLVLRSGQLRATRSAGAVGRAEEIRTSTRQMEAFREGSPKAMVQTSTGLLRTEDKWGFKSFGVHSSRDEQGWEVGMLRCRVGPAASGVPP